MNTEVDSTIKLIQNDYQNIETILVFGSATTPDWTHESDIDVFLIDDSLSDSRTEKDYNGILVELQEDNYTNLKKDMETERGNLLHRNLSTMIATATIVKTNFPEKTNELINFAKEILASAPDYTDEDIKMWRYSILDYLAKVKKDLARNDSVAFYIDAHYVLQNTLEMSLATHGTYMPQPKYLTKLLGEKDPELLQIWQDYTTATNLNDKLAILNKLSTR